MTRPQVPEKQSVCLIDIANIIQLNLQLCYFSANDPWINLCVTGYALFVLQEGLCRLVRVCLFLEGAVELRDLWCFSADAARAFRSMVASSSALKQLSLCTSFSSLASALLQTSTSARSCQETCFLAAAAVSISSRNWRKDFSTSFLSSLSSIVSCLAAATSALRRLLATFISCCSASTVFTCCRCATNKITYSVTSFLYFYQDLCKYCARRTRSSGQAPEREANG